MLFVVIATPPLAAAQGGDIERRFERFKQDRRQILDALLVPIEQCVRRRDTTHAAFRGCIDWHSSVHGTWALVKYTGLTGDRRYVQLITETLTPASVAAELRYLEENPRFELPYGRAWFLRLALDHKAVFRSELLTPAGDFVSRSLMDHYRRTPPDPLDHEYLNPSWALVNLHDYGVSRNAAAITDFVRATVRQHFLAPTKPCPWADEQTRWQEFMPICTVWAYLVARTNAPDDIRGWLGRFVPADALPNPINRTQDTYRHMAMNFSRCWGFWQLYKATGDLRYLKLYLDHFELQYRTPGAWKGDYREVGHWVAQFGVFALAPVFSE
jgi:hypothetical protein